MSKSPAAGQEQLRLLQEQDYQMQRSAAASGPSQYPAASQHPGQAINVEQGNPQLQHQRRSAQEKVTLVQAAARMAVDAANLAGQAAEMARQAADMAARAAGQPWEGPYQPPVQQTFDTFPRQGLSNVAPIPPQPPTQMDQPMENYQSQFPVAEAPKRKRKTRASAQEASGSRSRSHAAIAPNPAGRPETITTHHISDYQMQLMLLEQQNKTRLMRTQNNQQRDGEGSGSAGAPAANFVGNDAPRPEGLTDYQYQMGPLEQHNGKVLDEKNRLQQESGEEEGNEKGEGEGEGEGSGGA